MPVLKPATPTERDIAATLNALAEGRIDAARAAASLYAVALCAERAGRAEGRLAGLREAADVLAAKGWKGAARAILARAKDAPEPRADVWGEP